MRVFYTISLYLLFIIPSYGFDSFYVYVKNTTPHTLVLPHGAQVHPNAQAIFHSYHNSDIHGQQHNVTVTGRIYVKHKSAHACHVNFKTYGNFDTFVRDRANQSYTNQTFTERFATFIVVSEKDHRLICNPVAAEVSPHGHTMMPNGEQLTIKQAKKARKKFEKRQQEQQEAETYQKKLEELAKSQKKLQEELKKAKKD